MDKELGMASFKFSLACLIRLEEKAQLGWTGWNCKQQKEYYAGKLRDLFLCELTQKRLVDIANYANFLWNLIETDKEMSHARDL